MSTFLNNFFAADTAAMDSMFFNNINGLPSESKLATYMNRQNLSSPTYNHTNIGAASNFNLDTIRSIKKSQVTVPTSEFVPVSIDSPNYYSAYHTSMLSNGFGGTGMATMNGLTAMPITTSNAMNTTTTVLGLQKAAAATVAQQKQIQQQQQQSQQQQQTQPQQQQQPQPTVPHCVVNAVSNTPSLKQTPHQQQPLGSQSTSQIGSQSPYIHVSNNSMKTSHNNLLHNNSPANVVEKLSPHLTPATSPIPPTIPTNIHQENVGGTIYFYPTANHPAATNVNSVVVPSGVVDASTVVQHSASGNVAVPTPSGIASITPVQQPILYPGHIYPGPASNVIAMHPKTQLESAFFIADEMRAEIMARNTVSNLILDATEAAQHALPMEVDNYHSLYPLETLPVLPLHAKLTLPSSTYKATHSETGVKYCLRRLHGFRLLSTKCIAVVEMWKKLQHSNVVQLREIFTTKAFGDNSLVMVYDYHPNSQTLLAKYFTPSPEASAYNDPFQGEARPFSHKSNLQRSANGPLLSEATIWAIIMQLTSGLRAIHQAGLACKLLDPTKIIVTGKRLRFSFPGITDITQFDPNITNSMALITLHQQDDLTALGRLVLALAFRCLQSVQRDTVQSCIELISRHYSSDLRNFIVYLFGATQRRSVTDLMPMIGARFYTQLDALQSQCDLQEDELAKEMENGRLYRILVKMNCINERPDFNLDCTWSETGDRYMLKLFRDYLFHSVAADGRPWLDHAHIVQCLNKLDAGSMERVQLMSRDEHSVLIVTYAELKNCLEKAFNELLANAAT